MNTITQLEEVLKPSTLPPVRFGCPVDLDSETPAAKLVEAAARQVRDIYLDGIRRVAFDEKRPEAFFSECAETAIAAIEVENTAADEFEANIASTIFQRAGFYSQVLKPTTLRAQVEIQIAVIDAVNKIRWSFAKQQALV